MSFLIELHPYNVLLTVLSIVNRISIKPTKRNMTISIKCTMTSINMLSI